MSKRQDTAGSDWSKFLINLNLSVKEAILIKTELDGSTVVIDNRNIFKVVRNG